MESITRFLAVAAIVSLLLSACGAQTPAPTVAPPSSTPQPVAPTAVPQPASPTAVPKPAAAATSTVAYPQRPVNLIVAYPAGGPIDGVARQLLEDMKPFFPQPIVVVNRPGGGATVGTAEVLRAKPDGYTFGLTNQSPLVVEPHLNDLPYKTPDDYQPIINLVASPYVLATKRDGQWSTLKEFVDASKARPGTIRIGIVGVGLQVLALKQIAKADVTAVPFDGAADQMAALLGGHIEAVFLSTQPILAQVKAGTVKMLAVLAEKRDPQLPNVPIAREEGYDIVDGVYYPLFGPKGLPDSVVQTFHDAAKRALLSERFGQFASGNAQTIDYRGPADLKLKLQRDYALYGEMLKKR